MQVKYYGSNMSLWMREHAMETAPRHKNMEPDRLFRRAVMVTSAAPTGAIQSGPEGGFAVGRHPYHTLHYDAIKADTAQAAIRAAVPACAPYRTESLLLRNRCTGGNDAVKTGPGRSRKSGAGARPGRLPGRSRPCAARKRVAAVWPRSCLRSVSRAGLMPPAVSRTRLVARRRSVAPPRAPCCGSDVTDPCIILSDDGITKYKVSVRANPADARPARTRPGSVAHRPCGIGRSGLAATCRDGPAQAIPRCLEEACIPAPRRRRPRAGRLHSSCGAARCVRRRAETLRSPRRAGSHRPPRAAGGRAVKDAAFILPSSNSRMGTNAGGNRAGVRVSGRGLAYPAGGPAATSKRREFQKRASRPDMPGPVSGYPLNSTGGWTAVPDMPRRAALIGAIQNLNLYGPATQVRRLLSWDYRRRPGGRACNPGGEPARVRRKDARAASPGHGSGPGCRMDPGSAQGFSDEHGAAASCDCESVTTHRRSPPVYRNGCSHAFKREASVSKRRPCPRHHDTIRTKPKPCRRRLEPDTPDFHIPEASA